MSDIELPVESFSTPPRMTKSPVLAPDAPVKEPVKCSDLFTAKRHKRLADPSTMHFGTAMRKNYNRPAFNRLRDRIGCKAATSECSVVFNVLYQSVINRLVFNSMLIAGSFNLL
jgi:hypothetical protein